MYIVLHSPIYNQMATALVLPPVNNHTLTCKMVNLSATPAVTSVLYKIGSESIIEPETVPIIDSEKCGWFPPLGLNVLDMFNGYHILLDWSQCVEYVAVDLTQHIRELK